MVITSVFFDLSFYGGIINQNLTTSISSYILGCNNRHSIEFDSFSAMTFYGRIVDKYFNPSAKFDHISSSNDFELGSSVRKLKSFKEVDVRYALKSDLDLVIGVVNPSMPTPSNHSLGELHSFMRLQTDLCWNLDNVLELYRSIYRLFTFINFRSNISFDKVTISTLVDGKYDAVGTLFIASEFPCTDIHEIYTITYPDTKDKVVSLYNLLNTLHKHLCFIPINDDASRVLDYDSYMLTCAVFEKVFSLCYPKAVLNNMCPIHLEVREKIIGAIQELISTSIGEYREVTESYLNTFEHLREKTLQERFDYALHQNIEILTKVFPSINFSSEIICNISRDFKKQRHAFSHGEFERIASLSITPYTFAICLIYIMILKLVHIDEETVSEIIKKMFWNYRH